MDASALYDAVPSIIPQLVLEHHKPLPTALVSCEALSRRGLYSKEQWDAKKPLIWSLYNVENKSYNQVVAILRDEYSFFPTYAVFFLAIFDQQSLSVS